MHGTSAGLYRLRTATASVLELLRIPSKDVEECIEAYEYLAENSSSTSETDTEEETAMVRKYYSVAQAVLAVADIEKMYIPPQVDPSKGVYGNQILLEKEMVRALCVTCSSKILDIGCGRGRVAHHVASLTGAHVSGFNIDERQVEHANEHALATGDQDRLSFKVGNFQKRFPYEDDQFDASYDMQAIWGFTKAKDLDAASREIYRTLKPGGRFFTNTYALSPAFDKDNSEHVRLHSLYLPTLAATQSNYAEDIEASLKRAGFEILWSRPSSAPAWPLTDQKTTLFKALRLLVRVLSLAGLVPATWLKLIDNLLKGGGAWQRAERAKIADLCWQIVVRKPVASDESHMQLSGVGSGD